MSHEEKQREMQPEEEERKLLVQYLSEYKDCLRNIHIKEKRKSTLQRELRPRVNAYGKECKGQQTAGLSVMVDNLAQRIDEQRENACKKLIKIMSIIEYLPEESTERIILELKYIDCKSWQQIEKSIHLTRTPCTEKHKQALTRLLTMERVQELIREYREELGENVRTL